MSEIFHATLNMLHLSGSATYECFTRRACERGFLQSNKPDRIFYPLCMVGRPAPWVEMLLTTTTSHGRLQLQVERSVLGQLSYNVTHRQARKN